MKTLIAPTPTIKWKNGQVRLIDQTKLPLEEDYIETDDYQVVCDAIYRLAIRGAPAIGVAGAYACVLAANKIESDNTDAFLKEFLMKADEIGNTRPTAVNLMWAVKQMKEKAASFSGNVKDLKSSLLDLANEIKDDDIDRCHNLALHGAELIPDHSNVMTICNTGGLATSGIGTALGVIQYAHAQGKDLKVHVCEPRPLLQGARLNTWELTANKIGTYNLAVLAKHHHVPFYVAAPLSTVDYETESGSDIPVEERSPDEVTRIKGVQFTIEDIDVTTPAFDVTPAELIHGIITEKGVAKYPYKESLEEQRNAE